MGEGGGVEPRDEFDVWGVTGETDEGLVLRAITDDFEGRAGDLAGFDGKIDTFPGDLATRDDVIIGFICGKVWFWLWKTCGKLVENLVFAVDFVWKTWCLQWKSWRLRWRIWRGRLEER